MSKSYQNIIDIFAPEKLLKKQIMKIITDSKTPEEAKNPQECLIYQIFSTIAGEAHQQTIDLANKYKAGGLGYGHAKLYLFNFLMEHFSQARQKRKELVNHLDYIDQILDQGCQFAQQQAEKTMLVIRQKVGLIKK